MAILDSIIDFAIETTKDHFTTTFCYIIPETVLRRPCFMLACIDSHLKPAPHACSRGAHTPLPKLLVTVRAWPSPPASAPDPKSPRRRA
eukprot:6176988-Pleurochrysis_carterae.AAC.3